MTKSIVTGGAGFIGSHIVDKLVELGHDVHAIDDLSAPENSEFFFNKSAKNYQLDISTEECQHIFEDVDYVFHLAARSRIQPTISSPGRCFEVNVVGTQRVLEWARKANAKKVVYSGPSSLYGRQNTLPFQPNMPADCLNPYSMSKWMGEQVCKLYSQNYNLSTSVLRYFNVYGPREPLKGAYAPVIGLFKRQKKQGEKLTIVGDGFQRRDFTYIDDVVDANIKAAKASNSGPYSIYNVGSGKNYSILEVARMVGGEIVHVEERPSEVRETLADIEKTRKELGWFPSFDLEETIKSY